MKVAITGEKGFIGKHLTNYLKNILKYEVVALGRNYLENLDKIKKIDWLILGAFIHRNKEVGKVLTLNEELTSKTLFELEKNNYKGNILFLSSIQEGNNSEYGSAKLAAKLKYKEYCNKNESEFISIKLPNVFGGYAKPFNTSFVATFCYSIVNDLPVDYNRNSVDLIYINDLAQIISNFNKIEILPFTKTTVESVYLKLKEFDRLIELEKTPIFKNRFELNLFNTFVQYINYNL